MRSSSAVEPGERLDLGQASATESSQNPSAVLLPELDARALRRAALSRSLEGVVEPATGIAQAAPSAKQPASPATRTEPLDRKASGCR